MSKRKKSIRQMTKDLRMRAREDIGSFDFNGDSYNEIHVYATLHECCITLYNTKLPVAQQPRALDAYVEWKTYDWLYAPKCEHSLRTQVEKLILMFLDRDVHGMKFGSLGLRPSVFPTVLV
jgi:hypothetical protein